MSNINLTAKLSEIEKNLILIKETAIVTLGLIKDVGEGSKKISEIAALLGSLNGEGAPAKAKRKRRTPEEIAAAKAGGAA